MADPLGDDYSSHHSTEEKNKEDEDKIPFVN